MDSPVDGTIRNMIPGNHPNFKKQKSTIFTKKYFSILIYMPIIQYEVYLFILNYVCLSNSKSNIHSKFGKPIFSRLFGLKMQFHEKMIEPSLLYFCPEKYYLLSNLSPTGDHSILKNKTCKTCKFPAESWTSLA